ncbi:unnamed protein product [Rhizophagus irregularis]|nr:unnamed protein product [Rhizophagus irregularis]CAB5379129.1 unnamed protein product [Rhizophagus irregularis]
MKFKTTTNLSGTVPLAKYVNDKTYYRHAIQPEIYSGSDLVLSLVDDEQNVILLSASCTVSVRPIGREKIEKQLTKSCLGDIPANNEEDEVDTEEENFFI